MKIVLGLLFSIIFFIIISCNKTEAPKIAEKCDPTKNFLACYQEGLDFDKKGDYTQAIESYKKACAFQYQPQNALAEACKKMAEYYESKNDVYWALQSYDILCKKGDFNECRRIGQASDEFQNNIDNFCVSLNKQTEIYDKANGKVVLSLPSSIPVKITKYEKDWFQISFDQSTNDIDKCNTNPDILKTNGWIKIDNVKPLSLISRNHMPKINGELFEKAKGSFNYQGKLLYSLPKRDEDAEDVELRYWVYSTGLSEFPFLFIDQGFSGDEKDNGVLILFGKDKLAKYTPKDAPFPDVYPFIRNNNILINESLFCSLQQLTTISISNNGFNVSPKGIINSDYELSVPEAKFKELIIYKDQKLTTVLKKMDLTKMSSLSFTIEEAFDSSVLKIKYQGETGWVKLNDLTESTSFKERAGCNQG